MGQAVSAQDARYESNDVRSCCQSLCYSLEVQPLVQFSIALSRIILDA